MKTLLTILLFLGASLNAATDELMQLGDVHKVMDEIFQKHVNKKAMTNEIMKHAFKNYIEQFDPMGLYLLEAEVSPYINMGPAKLNEVVKEYQVGNFEAFVSLNEVIQKSIKRAQGIRSAFERDPKSLLENHDQASIGDLKGYPKTVAELKERIREQLAGAIETEQKRMGQKKFSGAESKWLANFEKQIRDTEDLYTYEEADGSPMASDEKENVFTLRILKALAKSLDAHTDVFDPKEAYDMRIRLEKGFDGVGIVFNNKQGRITVVSLVENSPAAKQGQIKSGDVLLSINGQDVSQDSFERAMKLLKDVKEGPINFSFERGKNRYEVTLKKETIVLNQDRVEVSREQFGDGIIGRITLHSFYQNDRGINSESDVRQAIDTLSAEGNLRGLVLDLRDNSGGFLSQAVKVAGLFITNGVIVISKYSDGNEKVYRDMDGKVSYKGPLVVLTSRATASAAEIVAQAIQDYGVGVIVGDERTYGKGTIQSQTVTDKKGGSFFKVTVGEYYTVSGNTPQLQGVKADVVVPGPYSKIRFGEENLEYTVKGKDQIPSAFADQLKDIDPNLRSWYLKYYMPTLQHRTNVWKSQLAQLQKNSAYRLANNKNYQLFLKRLDGQEATPEETDPLDEEKPTKSKGFGSSDLQLAEAYNIVKDMAYLESQAQEKEMMVGSEKN